MNAKQVLVSIALSDHMGDVNDSLPRLAELLGLPKPEWDEGYRRMVFPFEATEDVWGENDE